MRATLLGSTPTTSRVRCPACGSRLELDRRSPASTVCGGCGASIMQSLRVITELTFEPTPERLMILRGMLALERGAARLSERIADERSRARVERAAQYVTAQRNLLVQDWHAGT